MHFDVDVGWICNFGWGVVRMQEFHFTSGRSMY